MMNKKIRLHRVCKCAWEIDIKLVISQISIANNKCRMGV